MQKWYIKYTAIIGNYKFVLEQYIFQCSGIKVYVLDKGMHLIPPIHANNRNLAITSRSAHGLNIETYRILVKGIKKPPVLIMMKPYRKIIYIPLLQCM